MTRQKQIALLVAVAVVTFLLGFGSQWMRARSLSAELDSLAAELEKTRFELRLAHLEGRLGAALAESSRGNYERARQLMADFYGDLQASVDRVEDPADRRALQAILTERDEIITLLSRAEPEATQRLMLAYTRYFEAIDPAAAAAPTAVTPSPPAP